MPSKISHSIFDPVCPFCREPVRPGASICPHCRQPLAGNAAFEAEQKIKFIAAIIVGGIIVGIFFVLVMH
jgi:predicted amidophosphoribosyltransferase